MGVLMFYANTRASVINSGQVRNKFHQLMQNGDSLYGQGWYHEMVIVPMPENDSLFYLFSICVTSSCPYGLYYSIISVSSDSVILKNVQLQNFPMVDCITAVKHGNGRDWWLIFRRWYQNFQTTNEFFTYLISPAGITNFNTQMIGATHQANSGQLTFSASGNKLLFTNLSDLIELMDFDRCTGLLSNPVIIQPANPPQFATATWSAAFSSNDSVLYISTSYDTTFLYQLDLTAPNIIASKFVLDTLYLPPISGGALKLAPNGKIYFSCAYDNGINFNYPYADSMYNYINMNLSVINYPDSLSTACGYAPFSFYLGGKRTYYGLPNNPDYELGPLVGSACDSLTAISELPIKQHLVNIYPNPVFNYTTVTGTEKINSISIFDISGQALIEIVLDRQQFYSYSLNFEKYPPGIYFVTIKNDSFIETKKVVKL
jgi:hypothetical protein